MLFEYHGILFTRIIIETSSAARFLRFTKTQRFMVYEYNFMNITE